MALFYRTAQRGDMVWDGREGGRQAARGHRSDLNLWSSVHGGALPTEITTTPGMFPYMFINYPTSVQSFYKDCFPEKVQFRHRS